MPNGNLTLTTGGVDILNTPHIKFGDRIKKDDMKKIKKIVLCTFLFLILILFWLLHSPYEKIRDYDVEYGISPFTYLTLYKNVFSKKRFDNLIERLINENMDIKSITVTADFCKREKLYEYIPLLEQKCVLFAKFPKDTVWSVKITENYIRQSGADQLYMYHNFCKMLNDLEHLKILDSLNSSVQR